MNKILFGWDDFDGSMGENVTHGSGSDLNGWYCLCSTLLWLSSSFESALSNLVCGSAEWVEEAEANEASFELHEFNSSDEEDDDEAAAA